MLIKHIDDDGLLDFYLKGNSRLHKIKLDYVNKIITTDLSGKLDADDLILYYHDLWNLFHRFHPKECAFIGTISKLDPLSQESAGHFKQIIELCLARAKKIAIVHGNRTVTRMQMQRLEEEVRKEFFSEIQIMRFVNHHSAIKYILK